MNESQKYQQYCYICDLNKRKVTPNTGADDTSPDDIIMWEYECHQCQSKFKVPVPRGPAEEKQIRCTKCGSMDITRENIDDMQVVFCGG